MIEKPISEAARDVLEQARIEGTILYLPPQQLERKLYEEVNEVLTRLGGKWKSGKVKGHAFDSDPSAAIEMVIQTGYMPVKNPNAFFETPPAILERMFEHERLTSIYEHPELPVRCLEPSAGKGAIARALRNFLTDPGRRYTLHCCEIDPKFREGLEQQGFSVVASDFLTYTPQEYDYDIILMNPPFSVEGDQLAYITHIQHAYELLAPHGVLIAIAPPGYTFRSDKKSKEFRSLVETNGSWQKLPSKSFEESGTSIETTVLTLVKPTIQDRTERLVENAHKSLQVAERLRELVEDESMLRARNIPAPLSPSLDNAYELTRAIERAEAQRVAKDVPVFGDSIWISRAKKKRAS